MEQRLAPLAAGHALLLGYAILAGVEGPLLVALAVLKRRPAFERLLAAAPILVCFWAFTDARAIWTSYLYWRGELTFLASNPVRYLPQPVAADMAPAVEQAAQLGWELSAATAVALTLGWALLLRWFPRPARTRTSGRKGAAAPR
jgi:hypothetical protein